MLLRRFLYSLIIITFNPLMVFCQDLSGCAKIEELKEKYFPKNQYNEFFDELGKIKSKDKQAQVCLDYYRAFGRFQQLKHLEEKQLWDDYFANGNTYRQELEENADKAIKQAEDSDPLKIKSMLLLWEYHRGQQDAFSEKALGDLMSELTVYGGKDSSSADLIKQIADTLSANEEKSNARQAYKIYVDKLVKHNLSEQQLKSEAAAFYKEGNLELAKAVYDIYIDKISKSWPQEKLTGELFETASLFVYKPQGLFDMDYAEKIYEKIEQISPKAFSPEMAYLRAFNLEKLKEYKKAGEHYLDLINLFPQSQHYNEAIYKVAMISAYASANLTEARKYFAMLAAKPESGAYCVYSFYHLGLLAQWEGNKTAAKENYDALLKNAGNNYTQITDLAKERIKEIDENREITYNLKTFLDLALKKEKPTLEANQLDLQASKYILDKKEKFSASSLVNLPQSGCNQVQLQYLWSGDLGGANPTLDESSFQGMYPENGTKAVNLVVVSPSGIIDYSFIMADVY